MTDRESRDRLVELLSSKILENLKKYNIIGFPSIVIEELADHLIANGVIVPPCKVGDMVYIIKYCRCSLPDCFQNKHCYKKETKRTPKEYGRVMKQQNGRKLISCYFGKSEFEWRPIGTICHIIYRKPFNLNMLTEIGKTVFLTREEAEKRLEECK